MTAGRLKLRSAVLGATVLVGVASGCAGSGDAPEDAQRGDGTSTGETALSTLTIEVRNDPGCGCCTSWVEYLQEHGATVELTEDAERDAFRAESGIADDAASCHTAIVEGYAIEGHVPVGAIQRLLEDRPDAVGLALPGMPADGPGMGGNETTWERQPVMLIGTDGELTTFDY